VAQNISVQVLPNEIHHDEYRFSPSGKYLFTGGRDAAIIQFWHVKTGKLLNTWIFDDYLELPYFNEKEDSIILKNAVFSLKELVLLKNLNREVMFCEEEEKKNTTIINRCDIPFRIYSSENQKSKGMMISLFKNQYNHWETWILDTIARVKIVELKESDYYVNSNPFHYLPKTEQIHLIGFNKNIEFCQLDHILFHFDELKLSTFKSSAYNTMFYPGLNFPIFENDSGFWFTDYLFRYWMNKDIYEPDSISYLYYSYDFQKVTDTIFIACGQNMIRQTSTNAKYGHEYYSNEDFFNLPSSSWLYFTPHKIENKLFFYDQIFDSEKKFKSQKSNHLRKDQLIEYGVICDVSESSNSFIFFVPDNSGNNTNSTLIYFYERDLISGKLIDLFDLNFPMNTNDLSEYAQNLRINKKHHVIYLWTPGCFYLYNYEKQELLKFGSQDTNAYISGTMIISPDSDFIIIAETGQFVIRKADTFEHLNTVSSAISRTGAYSFTDDEKLLITDDAKGFLSSITVLDFINGVEIGKIYILGVDNFVFVTPDNYYFTSSKSPALHYNFDNRPYSFEQFDLKYNRPDIILDRIGNADSNLIAAYRKAYLKRLKKMNFTEDMLQNDFHLPEIKIENFESLPVITDDDTVRLNLKLEDSKYPIDRINIWINDVAIYGTNGISLREKNIRSYNTSLDVPLAHGKNKIQVSVLNQAGAESYKENIEIESTSGKITPDLYIVSLGVSKYADPRYNLSYASKDASDIITAFQKDKFFSHVFSKTLTDSEVVLENLSQLKPFFKNADINDQVIIFVAGHGVLDANFDYYFASYDMDFQNPSARGIPYEMIESLLDGIKPLKKLLFMDTCHSGEVDKDEIQVSDNKTESENDIVFRNVGVAVENKENQLGLQNTSELMKSLFTDLRKGTGATVISSAGGVEFAMESDTWQNGLFTYCLIDGLINKKADLNNDKMIMVSELQTYIQAEVNKLSNGKQTPTSRIENNEMDYRVW